MNLIKLLKIKLIINFIIIFIQKIYRGLGIGDLGVGAVGFGHSPKPQTPTPKPPIPNPQSPIPIWNY